MRILHIRYFKPRLFISYNRGDQAFADFLFHYLSNEGFIVFYDIEKILVGENFVVKITDEIAKADAVIALISDGSVQSQWCQAELYQAFALKKIVVPVHLGQLKSSLAKPLELLQRSIHYVELDNNDNYNKAGLQICKMLEFSRKKAFFRNLKFIAALMISFVALWAFWRFGILGINAYTKSQDRRDTLRRVEIAQSTLTENVIRSITDRFSEDKELISNLLFWEANPEVPNLQRLNAKILSSALLKARIKQKRWYWDHIDWRNSTLEYDDFMDITFLSGDIQSVKLKSVSFGRVCWGRDVSSEGSTLNLASVFFEKCQFHGDIFPNTNIVDSDFVNCGFQGVELGVKNFGGVHFFSHVADSNSNIITDEVSVFYQCTIKNCADPSPPNTLDFGGPENEVRFTDVIFDHCFFKGFIRPSWFKNCSFLNCSFPSATLKDELVQQGNIVRNCNWIELECEN